jgi:aromatic ring hydroxylase
MTTRTGAEYLAGLRDGREVWLAGRRVEDVLAEPVLAAAAHTVARLYDQQHDPRLREVLTYQDGAERYPLSLAAPRDARDLLRRGAAFRATAETTFGLLGRSPDFVNTAVTAFASAAPFFDKADPRFGRNVTAYHAACLAGDPFLSHTAINPPLSRARSSHEQDDPDVHLRIVRETSEGVVVRGAKLIGTLVPVADEIVVFPLPGYRPGDEAYSSPGTGCSSTETSTPPTVSTTRRPPGTTPVSTASSGVRSRPNSSPASPSRWPRCPAPTPFCTSRRCSARYWEPWNWPGPASWPPRPAPK